MATTLNTSENCANENEKTFFTILKDCLPNDFLIYAGYKNHIDKNSNDIDFILIHPSYGIWAIEQKSYRLQDLIEVSNNDKWTVRKGAEQKTIKNPFLQASDNANYLMSLLSRNNKLTNKEGLYKGNLKLPVNSFVVFDNITKSELVKTNQMYSEERTLSKDFIYDEQNNDSDWEERIKKLRGIGFPAKLSKYDIEEIKRTLKISQVVISIDNKELGITDIRQENLIKENFKQHLLIEGPAGSGKSVIIVLRAIEIKTKHPEWKVAIFIFTKFMANYITTMLKSYESIYGSIDIPVYDIFEFANNKCINKPDYEKHKKINPKTYFESALSEAIEIGFKEDIKFDALLIDEGQDIKDIHAKLYSKILNPLSDSVTICFDSRQDIYGGNSIVEELNRHGFHFATRPKPLIKQQRSLLIFLGIALYDKILYPEKAVSQIISETEDITKRMFFGEVGEIFEKELRDKKVSGFFKGLYKSGKLLAERIVKNDSLSKDLNNRLEIIKKNTLKECVEEIVILIKSQTEQNDEFALSDCLIIYPFHQDKTTNGFIINTIHENFKTLEIPYIYIGNSAYEKSNNPKARYFDGKNLIESLDNRLNADLNSDTVKIMTAHTAKGFDRKNVFVLNFDEIDITKNDATYKPHSLSYVILTRAVEKCYLFYKNETPIIKHLKEITDYIHDNEV